MFSTHRRSVLPRWLSISLTASLLISGFVVAIFAFLSLRAFLDRPLNPVAEAAEAVAMLELAPLPQSGQALIPALAEGEPAPTPIPTTISLQESERVNVLVMGIDRRPGEPFISRTDTMILMSIHPEKKSASMLSIPRDLYVVLPGRGRDRINTAFVYGSTGNNPAGGAQLAMQTVEYNLGVPVHHYILVDFAAVIQGVDAIGGIDVDVPREIYDPTFPDMNYGFDPLYIPAGSHHFDGLMALKYARTRHVDNDFGRARRQQQVIMAVRDKIVSLGLSQLVRRAPTLYRNLEEGVRTDLSLEEIIRLAATAAEIPQENIRSEVLDQQYVNPYRTERGAAVLVPVNQQVASLIQSLFYDE